MAPTSARTFPGVDAVLELLAAELAQIKSVGPYPPGTTILLEQPLKSQHKVLVVAVTEKLPGAGIRADTASLTAALESVMRVAVDNRLSELHLPVMGTGHGGLDLSVALSLVLLQLSHGMRHGGYHSLKHVTITVYDPDGQRAPLVERLGRSVPMLWPV